MKRSRVYLRVSTSKQDTDNQRRELEAVAHALRLAGGAGVRGRWHQRQQRARQASWASMQC